MMHIKLLHLLEQAFNLQIIYQRSPVIGALPFEMDAYAQRSLADVERDHAMMSMANEATRSSRIVTPLILSLLQAHRPIHVLCGAGIAIKAPFWLNGLCDYWLTEGWQDGDRERLQAFEFTPPVRVVVETKSHVSTLGLEWQFLQLEGDRVRIDETLYPLLPAEQILGFLAAMIN